MESVQAILLLRMEEDSYWEVLQDIVFGSYFRHVVAIVFHLIFIVSLILSLCWRRYILFSVSKPDFSKNLQFGVTHKVALAGCVSLSVLYTILGTWSPLSWWLGEKPKDFAAEEEYIVQAISWAIISAYAYHSVSKESKEKIPLLLRMWWSLSLILYVFFFFLNIKEFKVRKGTVLSVMVEVLGLVFSIFLFYVSCCDRNLEGSFDQTIQEIQEPLLNDIPAKHVDCRPKVTPYATANFFSRLTFSWINPLLAVGHKKALGIDDVPQVADVTRAAGIYHNFSNQLEAEGHRQSIARVTYLFVKKDLLFTAFLKALNSISLYVGPYFIDSFVQCLAGQKLFASEGIVLVCAFLLAQLVASLTDRYSLFVTNHMSIRIRAALTATIYRKGLMLSSQSRHKHMSGEIINYMSVDAQRIGVFCWYVHDIWMVPFEVVLSMIILYQSLGLASLAALAATVVVMIANFPLGKIQKKNNKKIMEAKDERMKATSETLRNMKILKLQAWETKFLQRLQSLRKEECNWLKKFVYTAAVTSFTFYAAPTVVSVVTFGTCVLMEVPLTAGRILSALATFRMLAGPIYALPDLINVIAQTKVSLERVTSFLQQEEVQQDAVEKVSKETTDMAIEIKEGVFSWDPSSSSPTIRGLNVKIERGMRVAVCGTVGSGKSSLLSCMLGEIPKISGTLRISGTKAYVPQSPWIQSGKVEDNILFGREKDKTMYEIVLQACALEKDLELLPNGDQTQIGERGINLSGGQKQRMQIARALYQDADIYLFDDPFSAVDAHTGTHIFQQCLLGILGSKTVVYVTHQMEFLFAADLILVMRDGEITQSGKYDDILKSSSDFEDLVGAHQKAMKSIDAMEKSETLSSNAFVEEFSSDNTASEKNVNHKQLQKQGIAQNTQELEEENESENHKSKEKEEQRLQLVQEEERESGRVSGWVYWSYITAAYSGALVPIILLAQISFHIFQISSNYWMAWATPTTKDQTSLVSYYRLIVVYISLAIASALCILVRSSVTSLAGLKSANRLFNNMHRCMFHAPMSFFDATPTGRILNRASTDQTLVDQLIPFQLGALTFSVLQLLGIIVVISQVVWQSFIMFLPVLAICIWYQQYYIVTSRELSRLIGICKAPIIQHFAESISGVSTIRSFDQESRFMNTNLEMIDGYSRPSFHFSGAAEWLGFRLDLLSNLMFGFSMVLLFWLPEGLINPSIAGLAITYGFNLNSTQSWVIWNFCEMENKMISVERIFQYSSMPSEAPLVIEKSRPSSDWPSRGTISIIDLQVNYAPQLPLVLKGLTCTFPGGKKVGIVGRTGSGKSTLIQSLFRIVEPAQGRIVIDGIDISTIGLHDLRSKLSVIPQEPTMFEGTIRTNLDPLGDYSDAQIWEALEKCQLGEVVREKPGKLDSLVNENGENWSVGQRQLVCLGRVLLKRSRILVLDEATASVDTATDWIIQQTINNQFSGCTVITIAHRIPSVCDSDLVLVLSDGKIAEYDTPTKLLEDKSSQFARLVSEYSLRSPNL
ncbi:putative ABC transporter C family member 15 [Cryptomeria japonica]|uniref:putative ABC transporter C family member 15 n=1 Tax=Cryptomeria japonica TaxID=3369 RepID=UPI0027DA41BD|nr:putative ABC transporter C family member 15 [Cryptomeria japonica]